jgi:SAM-dependent methyltransferase
MRLSHKLKKLINRDAYESAKATLLRLSYPLHPKPFIDAIDREAFNAIKERYFNPRDSVSPKKYLNLEDWMHTNVKRVRDLRIRKAPPHLRILDIGCGSGYFLHIAKCLGHDVLGMDLDKEPIFRETIALLGLKRIIHRIEPFQRLPDTGAPFDLITAHMTRFNWHADEIPWGPAEWEFFLNDLASRLTLRGRVQFDLNALPDGRHMEADLREFFLAKGARIDRRRIHLQAPFAEQRTNLAAERQQA